MDGFVKNYFNQKQQLNDGSFAEHQNQVYIDLFKDISRYYFQYRGFPTEERIFYALCDLMHNNQEHYIWNRFNGDAVNFIDIEHQLTSLAKKMMKVGLYTQKGNKITTIPVDKFYKMEWTKEYKTPKSLIIRHSKKGYVAIKSISPNGLIFKENDFNKFCADLKINLDTFTWHQLERLIQDYRINPKHQVWGNYPTMKFFEESLEVEKKLQIIKKTTQTKYEIGKGFTSNQEKITKDNSSTTMNVFDF